VHHHRHDELLRHRHSPVSAKSLSNLSNCLKSRLYKLCINCKPASRILVRCKKATQESEHEIG
jgi:hypothetical protein